jgi:hypothetical protein
MLIIITCTPKKKTTVSNQSEIDSVEMALLEHLRNNPDFYESDNAGECENLFEGKLKYGVLIDKYLCDSLNVLQFNWTGDDEYVAEFKELKYNDMTLIVVYPSFYDVYFFIDKGVIIEVAAITNFQRQSDEEGITIEDYDNDGCDDIINLRSNLNEETIKYIFTLKNNKMSLLDFEKQWSSETTLIQNQMNDMI